ncbi:hypothetical protein CDD83_7714 [Cordyceps sp. RAO-2017]|nr:hypothetical protein CDD83_7714 [Cordyceps sp. RAO-2017]
MDETNHAGQNPTVARQHLDVDDWEEWEDDHVVTPVNPDQLTPPLGLPPAYDTRERPLPRSSASRASRLSTTKVKRLRSRRRQKAQNARAGIKLITDMTVFKRANHNPSQARPADARPPKFVDAAALRALEGEPSSASIGSWNWLRRDGSRSPASPVPQPPAPAADQELSPEDRPIVIGISLPPDQMSSRELSPQTAGVESSQTPMPPKGKGPATLTVPSIGVLDVDANGQRSVWSPDTPDTAYSFNQRRAASSMYSQAFMPGAAGDEKAPPVPALPANLREPSQPELASHGRGDAHQNEDENGTPCTPFEEDGALTVQRQAPTKGLGLSPDSATSRSHGWWDHVVTPFLDKKLSFSSRKIRPESPRDEPPSPYNGGGVVENAGGDRPNAAYLLPVQAPIVREPTPRRGPSLRREAQTVETSERPASRDRPQATGEAVLGRNLVSMPASQDSQREQPPPYSPPKKRVGVPVRFRAVFPPQHPLHAQFPPSPSPASPGLAATMTSQGATQMTTIPLTPTIRDAASPMPQMPLPVRAPGTCVPEDHAHAASGRAHRVERQRRRHEKEEVMARRVGGFWRGRGCVPAAGCFGRSGREGRKRRRAWLALWAAVLALLILIITLAVVFARRHHEAPREEPSIWVNLTDFPPMPTGILTVVGTDNTVSRSACTEPSTLWSCSLPKDEHDTAAPYGANQPTIVLQVQWDNSTQNGATSRREPRAVPPAHSTLRARQTALVFRPEPRAPNAKEMWFLGNTTDNIQSENKAGEPTPFYISLLKSAQAAVDSPRLSRRGSGTRIGNQSLEQLLPPPNLEADGTPSPAVMLPNPVQQPVRLFDRGLPTEHFGFYTHFRRSIFLKSVTILNKTEDGNIPLDKDGGCRRDEADYLVTWGETRVLVQIWTRALDLNTSSLLRPEGNRGIGGTGDLIRPGTMPYPVTVTLDTHGGDALKKVVWSWPIDKRQKVGVDKAALLANRMDVAGTWINPRGTGDRSVGGFDGGTGGCKCEWVNWVHRAS